MTLSANNPNRIKRDLAIANDRMSLGSTYRELAEKYELTSGRITQILNDKEIKDVIETGTRQMVARVPLAIHRFDTILNDPESSDHYKAIKDCLTITGISPSHTSNTIINNIFVGDHSGAVSAEIKSIMRHQTDQQALEDGEYEVIDV